MAFTIATWNILADAYIRPADYPDTDPARLDPEWRRPAVLAHAARLGADVLCLQEVESVMFEALRMLLGSQGYEGHLALKAERQEGPAVFVRSAACTPCAEHILRFTDGSGCVALVLLLEHEGRRLGVAATHLKYDLPATPPEQRRGLRQARQLAAELPGVDPSCAAWLVCGDLNAQPDDAVVQTLRAAGFADSFAAVPDEWTCNSSRRPRRIDFVLASGRLRSEPLPQPPLDGLTPLPCLAEPSDHRPVMARVSWR